MSLEAIEKKILDAARESGERSLAEAQAKRDALFAERKTGIDAAIEDLRRRRKKTAVEKLDQELSGLRLEEKNKAFREKRAKLDAVFADFRKKILDGPAYAEYWRRELEKHAQSGDTLVSGSADRDFANANFAELLRRLAVRVSDEKAGFERGFLLVRAAGDIRINCSLDEWLKGLVEDSVARAGALLFKE